MLIQMTEHAGPPHGNYSNSNDRFESMTCIRPLFWFIVDLSSLVLRV